MRKAMSPAPEHIQLELPEPPSANVYWRKYRNRITRSGQAKGYLARVRAICLSDSILPLKGDVDVELVWYRSRKAGDVDNRIKICLDALKGFCYADDKQVRKVSIERIDGYKPAHLFVQVRQSIPTHHLILRSSGFDSPPA